MQTIHLNIDLPDIERERSVSRGSACAWADASTTASWSCSTLEAPIYLLRKAEGTPIGPAGGDVLRYVRHWLPIHLGCVVDDLDGPSARVTAKGAVREGDAASEPYGRLAMLAVPFGQGFCPFEFNALGYDAPLTARGRQTSREHEAPGQGSGDGAIAGSWGEALGRS